jgi:GNAT superfamily N-acetyltransferase
MIPQMKFRKATRDDVPHIVKMLSNDILGNTREEFDENLNENYYEAFENINNDVNQKLIVVEDEKCQIIGTMQMSFIQYLTYKGGIRAQIEAVRIREDQRGKGIGEQLLTWAIGRAKERGAHLVQLTTDKRRSVAVSFYQKLGFKPTHEGMKLHLKSDVVTS